jgi:hypothetical protein
MHRKGIHERDPFEIKVISLFGWTNLLFKKSPPKELTPEEIQKIRDEIETVLPGDDWCKDDY